MTTGQIASADDALQFMLAGKATITLVSAKTGTRFTYKVTAAPDGKAHFVSLLGGPDNEADYRYLGRISGGETFWAGRRTPKPGDVGPEAPSSKAFAWAWRALLGHTGPGREVPPELHIWHEGRCGRCNRKLTVPASIATGMGPECAGKSGVSRMREDYGN